MMNPPDEQRPAPTHSGCHFVDVNAQVGPRSGGARGALIDDLLAERERHGIGWSLVRHRTALLAESEEGNRALLELCAGERGLRPIAVLSAKRTSDLDQVERHAAKFAGFWLEGGATPGSGLAADRVARAAARTGLPLLVPISGNVSAARIGAATDGLGVPVVLIGSHYTTSVEDLEAGRRYEHLSFDTSSMAHFEAIETAVGVVGAERILLGTGSPLRASQPSINAILAAAIPDASKRAILGGNAARMFGFDAGRIDVPDLVHPDRVFDVHAHSGPLPWDVPDIGDDELLPVLRTRVGARLAIASSVLALSADLEAGNRRTVEGCARLPGRLGYLVADPNDIETARDHLRRWSDAPGIAGIKVHAQWSRSPTGSRQMAALFEVLAGSGRPVLIHNDGPGWHRHLERIARRHPRLPIIVAHAGPGVPSVEAAGVARATDNVYLELSSSFAELATVREVVRRTPAGRLLFGSDAPLLDPAFILGTYQDAGIPVADESRVYWGNAADLFQVPEPPRR